MRTAVSVGIAVNFDSLQIAAALNSHADCFLLA